jgi:hypothetical protein
VPEWAKGIAPEHIPTLKTTIEAKKWTGAADVVRDYFGLQALVKSGPVESLIRIPGDDADEATRAAFFTKLGRPEKPDGYVIPEKLKDDPIAQAAREPAHKLGLSAKQYEGMVAWVAEQGPKLQQQEDQKVAGDCTKADGELRALWGQAYDRNVQAELAVQRHLGLTDDELVAMARTSGPKSLRERLAKAGLALLEAEHKGGVATKEGALRGLSPAEAKERRASLDRDPDFLRRIKTNDPAALKERRALTFMIAGLDPDEEEAAWQRAVAAR